MRRFNFSFRVTVIVAALSAGMFRASLWQWDRYQWKQGLIRQMESNLLEPVAQIGTLISQNLPAQQLVHRRVNFEGLYDFSNEVILQNRRYDGHPGVHVITPLKLAPTGPYVLVNRSFLPLAQSSVAERAIFRRSPTIQLTGLIKESQNRRWLAPKDPPSGSGNAWVDRWLRVDIASIQKQLPYPVLPFYLEIIPDGVADLKSQLVDSSAGREDIFYLSRDKAVADSITADPETFPIPVFNTVVPAGRHLGYVYEWSAMGVGTIIIGLLLQLRRTNRG